MNDSTILFVFFTQNNTVFSLISDEMEKNVFRAGKNFYKFKLINHIAAVDYFEIILIN